MSVSTTRRARRTLRALAVTSLLVLAPAAPAFAKGGGGGGGGGGTGGGTTTSVGVIKNRVGAFVTCTGGTNMSLTVQKGFNKAVESVIVMSGTTGGWWDFRLTDDIGGRLLLGYGSGRGEQGPVQSVTTVSTGATLPKGTWPLTFTATRRVDTAAGALLETCSANLTVVAV